jgi:hypothetical protein
VNCRASHSQTVSYAAVGYSTSIVPVMSLWNVHLNSVGSSGTVKVAVATSPGSMVPVDVERFDGEGERFRRGWSPRS